jgi:tetratricopeptide (TPR) repeat protein
MQDQTSKVPQIEPTPTITVENKTIKEPGNKADYQQKFLEGSQYLGEGDFAAAIDSYNESIRMNSSFPDAYFGRGMAFFQTGYYNFYELRGKEELLHAVDDFSKVLLDDPENTEALIGRGAAYVYLGDYYSWRSYIDNDTVFRYYEAALSDFNSAIKTSPDSIDGLNGKAYASLMLGSGNPARKVNSVLVDAAKQDAEQSLTLNNTNPRAHFILGLYYDYEGHYVAAIDEFSKAIQQDPYEAWYYEWRGYEKFLKGDYSDAIEDYNAALAIQPRFADTYSMRGVARTYLMNTNDRSPELSDFNQAIEISPDISEFRRYYALVLASWKYWDKSLNEHAVDILSRASELDPSDYRIYGDKVSLLTALNRNHEATQQLIKYQQGSQTNEEKMMANDLLAYNNVEPWYSNTWG